MTYYILFSCLFLHIFFLTYLSRFIICRMRLNKKLGPCTKRHCVHCSTCPVSAVNVLNKASDILDKAVDEDA